MRIRDGARGAPAEDGMKGDPKVIDYLNRALRSELTAEIDARALYLEAAQYCDSVNDRVSKILFEELAADEEGHIDFLETQLELVSQVGVQLYAQKHIGGLE